MLETRLLARTAIAACACLLVGCLPSLKGNPPREANKHIPTSFGANQQAAAGGKAASAAQQKFGEFFHSPELKGLIDTALKSNQELNIRLQEIIIAQNEISARQGAYLPTLNAQAGVGVDKVGKYTSQGASDEATGLPKNLGNFQFGLMGSWEIDVWKKLRNGAKAATLRYLAGIEGKNFMATQLVAEIARSYFDLVSLDAELEVLKRNIALQTDALEVVKLEKQAARVTELAVQRFEAEVQKNKGRLYDVEQERVQAENRINFLVGRYPQPVHRDLADFNAPLPDVVDAGLPSQLLENRPDVRQAELQLEAAKLDVKVAKAEFYPSLKIDAGIGYRAFNPAHLVATPESLVYGIGAGLSAPLLNRSVIAAQYKSANAMQLQAVFNYEKTLLQAFTDVANQLAMMANLRKSYDMQTQQVDTLARSVDISNTLFQSARADYMEVLLTRRDSLEAQVALIETKKRQLQAMVNMYQALGGGWRASRQ